MNPQKIARITGILLLITFVASIPAQLILYKPLLDHVNYILGSGSDTRIYWGALLEAILVVANIGTAVVLYPIVKRQNEVLALGYVAERIAESVVIMMGIFSLLSIVTLHQDLAGASGANAASLVTAGRSLVAFHDWTFLFGPGFLDGIGTGIFLGYLMYRSNLVPRRMAMLGLIGGPLLLIGFVGVLFGVFEAGSGWQVLATAFEFVWELSLGIYLLVWGFKPQAVVALGTRGPATEPTLAAA
ncbi:MAG TPA: DUF4386 domain-containing protein [Actinomycetota bacterium]|nr:DUF4386 domain-containing protein [Actinomycetota bacterium]